MPELCLHDRRTCTREHREGIYNLKRIFLNVHRTRAVITCRYKFLSNFMKRDVFQSTSWVRLKIRYFQAECTADDYNAKYIRS